MNEKYHENGLGHICSTCITDTEDDSIQQASCCSPQKIDKDEVPVMYWKDNTGRVYADALKHPTIRRAVEAGTFVPANPHKTNIYIMPTAVIENGKLPQILANKMDGEDNLGRVVIPSAEALANCWLVLKDNYPPHDIFYDTTLQAFRFRIALAGWRLEDLELSVEDSRRIFLRGVPKGRVNGMDIAASNIPLETKIAKRSFGLRFELAHAHHIIVDTQNISCKDGIFEFCVQIGFNKRERVVIPLAERCNAD